MAKFLVTGGAGFIGSHLVDQLARDGHDVVVIDPAQPVDKFPAGVRHIEAEMGSHPGGEVVPPRAQRGKPFSAVFHLAGPVGPVGVLEQAGSIGPAIVGMAQWLSGYTCPVVYVSTSEVYGEQPQPVSEDASLIIGPDASARAEYAAGKLAAEQVIRNSLRQPRIVRPFNVAGPRQQSAGGFVIPRFIESATAGEPLTVYGDGSQTRAFAHVEDIAAGIYAAAIAGKNGRVYNLGNAANACSILDLAFEVREAVGSSSDVQFVDPQTLHGPLFREAPDKVPTTARAYSELSWSPKRDRADVISDAVAWYDK